MLQPYQPQLEHIRNNFIDVAKLVSYELINLPELHGEKRHHQ